MQARTRYRWRGGSSCPVCGAADGARHRAPDVALRAGLKPHPQNGRDVIAVSLALGRSVAV